jgi:hypothetical protein
LNSLEMSKLEDGNQRPSSQGNATIRPVSFHSRTSSGDSTGRRVPPSSTPPVSNSPTPSTGTKANDPRPSRAEPLLLPLAVP